MKAKVNPETCTGCELCTQTCPDVFKMNDNGVAEAISGTVPAELEGDCQVAAEDCPVDAIEIEQ